MKELVQSLSRLSGNLPQLGLDGGSNGNPGYVDHRYKKLRYTYDLISGNVKKVSYQPGRPDQFHHRYTYDADNRITLVETSGDNVNWYTDAEYFYYPHGPLQRVELGQHKVQGMDYAYTLQGWLKGINSDRLTPETDMGQDGLDFPGNPNALVARDAYGESIGYYGDADFSAIDAVRWDNSGGNRPFATVGHPQTATGTLHDAYNPLYNGNIAHTVNSLQPWGGWTSPTQPAQVLAQVYRYDQLNRLKRAQGVEGLTSANTWNGVTDATADRYKSEYWYDANGNIDTLARFDRDGAQYDGFNYRYRRTADGRLRQNRLYELHDGSDEDNLLVNAGADEDAEDIKHHTGAFDPDEPAINTAYNYGYDELGNLVRDDREGITHIDWTVAGKVRSVAKATGPSLLFGYGAGGQRISKTVGDPDNGGYREHYIRDAQGNIMAVYKYTNSGTASTKVVERPVYGSSRLGSYALAQEVMGTWLSTYPFTQLLSNPDKRYELTDHLGNVNTVVSGRLLDGAGAGSAKQAEVLLADDHEPFGALLPGRNYRQPVGGPPPPPVTPKGVLVLTEFSNDHYTGAVWGPSTDDCDYIELFVAGCSHYPEATEVDIRGWIVDDNANNFNSGGGCTGNILTTAGHLRFADSPTWESVPAGSIIVLYNTTDNASCFNFTADLTGSGGVYYIPVGSTGLIQASSDAPTSSSCDYCTATYASYNPWWGIVTDNERDAIQVRCPGCGEDGNPAFYHGLSWGTTDMGPIAAGGNDLGGAHMNMSGRGQTFILDTDDLEEIKAGLGWTSTTAVSSRPTAGSVSAQLRAALLGRGLPCCAGNEPVIAEKATYRFGFQGQEKDNEVYGSEGNSYDFVARMYDARVGRWPSIDPLAAKYPFVTPYGFTNNSPILNREQDGREWVNVHAQRLASLRERQLNNPNDKSIQRAIARETKSAARIDALLTAVRTNDQALYNYVDQLRVQISKDGFQNVKVFVSDDPRVSGPGGEKGSTGFLPESPTGTTKAVGFNGEGILAPYAMGEIGFDVKIHATAGDATLANEAGDVMFQMEYGAKDALQGRSKLTTDMNLNVDEYRKKESTRYSDRVEERYSERKKNGQGADSGNNPYPLPRNEEKPK